MTRSVKPSRRGREAGGHRGVTTVGDLWLDTSGSVGEDCKLPTVVRATATTEAPASARAVAMLRPRPRLAPTTIAVLSESSLIKSSPSTCMRQGMPRVGAKPERTPKMWTSRSYGLGVMALAGVLPSDRTTTLLEREAQVAGLQPLADTARDGGGRFVIIEGTTQARRCGIDVESRPGCRRASAPVGSRSRGGRGSPRRAERVVACPRARDRTRAPRGRTTACELRKVAGTPKKHATESSPSSP